MFPYKMADRLVFCTIVLSSIVAVGLVSGLPSSASIVVSNVTKQSIFQRTYSCLDVKQVYVMKKIGDVNDVPTVKTPGTHLSLCTSNTSCCTKSMEAAYTKAVQNDFWTMLQAASTDLKTLLFNSASKFRESFLEMIQLSRNNTVVLFSDVYKKMDIVSRGPVTQLYTDLTAYILGETVDLEAQLSVFFDELFPLVYHHSINPNLKDFSEDYKECLRQTQAEIRPFGDIADKMKHQIVSSLSTARTIITAFQLGVDVVNATDHMEFTKECREGLVKLVYCAHCNGYVRAKPCSGYCLNVVRGCLASVAELDQAWIDYVSALERVSTSMVTSYNVEEVLGLLDTKISEAIMYAMENGPDLSKRVKTACGHPRRATRDVSEPDIPPVDSVPGRIVPARTTDSLYVQLQQVVHKLTETKGQYANLADVLCSDDSWAVRKEGQCWNGESLGEYTNAIAGVGIAAQRYNPEMGPPTTDDLMVKVLEEKLEHMTKILRHSVTPDRPQADSYTVEGSGSGGWNRNRINGGSYEDDEDYFKGSGSGDGGGTKPSGGDNVSGDSRHRNTNIKTGAATSSTYCSTIVIVLVTLFNVLSQCRFSIIHP